jgi:prophage tail gpP-like protein/uncharacterized protein YcbK (DUF882 family)
MISAKAVITTKWGKTGYRPLTVREIEDFYVDTALDSDTDTWQFSVGDPDQDLIAVLRRDNEVRCNLYAVTDHAVQVLQGGFADEIALTQEGVLAFQGRDITAPAVDSAAPPGSFRGIRPDQLVAKEARMLKIGDKLKLKRGLPLGFFMRDGSETYWESWYRFYRRRRMWLWAAPNGTLHADVLNYDDPVRYKFGSPRVLRSGKLDKGYIQVERLEIRKSTAQRLGEVWVLGEHANVPFLAKAVDRTTADWVKRPRKIMDAVRARGPSEARHEAWLEIHESKVGSLEITMTVADPGFLIQQNSMSLVNIPEAGLKGLWFVVGARYVGGTSEGLYQEIRLREKGYAISRKIPADPEIPETPEDRTSNEMGASVGRRWGDAFVKAAKEHHGAWDFDLFLACLLAMCERESGYRNVREGGSVEWYDPTPAPPKRERTSPDEPPTGGANRSQDQDRHRSLFANDPGSSGNPFSRDAGVGPMQLTTHGYKVWADEYFGKRDEFVGGRWHAPSNIRAAARALASKLAGIPTSPATNIYLGVMRYNGAGPAAREYAASIRKRVEEEFLATVQESRTTAAGETANTVPLRNARRVDPDNFRDVPTDIGQRGTCGWPTVHPDIYTAAVNVGRRFQCRIASAYRSESCNRKVGGATQSDHLCGVGVDYVGSETQMAALARWATKQGYAMVIYGPLKIGPSESWSGHRDHVHISFIRCSDLK